MFRILFLLFIAVPIIEIMVLMQVGAFLGAWPTIAIVILTAWFGAKKVRQQGLATLSSVQTKMAQGQMPSDEIVAGVLLLVSGVLLLTPGFVTDFFGLALLVPQFRQALIKAVQQKIVVSQVARGGFSHQSQHFSQSQGFSQTHEQAPGQDFIEKSRGQSGHTLEGDFERKD
ncbi:FxsA family protein [Thalassomonas actiniarum]|uniref:FxsA family protein n=1 Tax=Thalassomonas actiniarum TaxID=485447 RepID=A0AAF0C076_9GAMM|nr:FxsA family protein [Thalassomonas actiniarum]WDD98256.1 FxsA family protein [Thalassomonas actiniarum]